MALAALWHLQSAPASHGANVIAGTVTHVLFTAWGEGWELRRT